MSTDIETQPLADATALEKQVAAMDISKLETPSQSQSQSQSPSVAASLQEKPPGPVKTPFVSPIASVKIKALPDLTPDQQTKYNQLLETAKSWKEIPSTIGLEGPIEEDEIIFLTRECLLRYLRATKWNTVDAAKRLLETLTWRREYGTRILKAEDISVENETGKQIILGFDFDGRPCHYLSPGLQNTDPSPRQVQHLVFMVERVLELLPPGQECLALLTNFKSSKTRTNTSPPLSQGREVLNILQTHYPERLGRACIINVPWIVWGFFKLITPFIDPLTREKLKFNEDIRLYVPPEQLWKDFGGDVDFEYNHDTYWPALNKLCQEKKAEQKARWEKAGKLYGESETYLKGGDSASVGQELSSKAVIENGTGETVIPPLKAVVASADGPN